MDAQEIIAKAQSGDVPRNWHVWPLRRDRVLKAMAYWVFVTVVGFILLIPTLIVMIPGNFQDGMWKSVISLLVLIFLAIMAFGGLYYVLQDARRLRLRGSYLLIMTPDDYVKLEPRGITHVPMDQIADITLKGVTLPEDRAADLQLQNAGSSLARTGQMLWGAAFNRKPKSPPSLAFRDLRTGAEVIVTTDDGFDELYALEEVLSLLVNAKRRTRRA